MAIDFKLQIDRALKKKLAKKIDLSKITKKDLKSTSENVVELIKKLISKGISPIKGKSRFPAYKDPEVYPKKVRKRFPSKRTRPVNLKLSGKFLKNLKAKIRQGKNPSITIGFFDSYGETLETGHREGANTQPERPIIPIENEEFKEQVERELRTELTKIIKQRLRKK